MAGIEKSMDERVEAELEDDETMLPPRQQGYGLLRVMGVPQVKAAQMCGYGKGMSTYLEKKLQKKYDLTSKKFIKLAACAIESILKGQPFGKVEKIKDSSVIAAAQMVYDRIQPKNEESITKEEITFININLDGFK